MKSQLEHEQGLWDKLMTKKTEVKGQELGPYRSAESRFIVEPSLLAKIVENRKLMYSLGFVATLGALVPGVKYASDQGFFESKSKADINVSLPVRKKAFPIYLRNDLSRPLDQCENICGSGTYCEESTKQCEGYDVTKDNFSGQYEIQYAPK